MKVTKVVDIKTFLELDEEERKYLHGITQNALAPGESKQQAILRERFFTATEHKHGQGTYDGD